MKRSLTDRRNLILGFTALYITVQLFFILRAHFVTDKRFGFWMFAETTFFSAKLYRVTNEGKKIRTKNGVWRVRNEGKSKVYSWNRMVMDYRLNNLERSKRAKGSIERTLFFLQAALDYVIDQIDEDDSTRQLLLEVKLQRAGRPEEVRIIQSKQRMN